MEDYQKIAAIKQALHTDEHYLVVFDTTWFIRHPLACRDLPSHCWTIQWVRKTWRPADGTYRIVRCVNGPEPEDVHVGLEPVPDGTDKMMDRLKELGVW